MKKLRWAFVDTNPVINLAYGVAGMSIAVDSTFGYQIC